MQEAGLLVPAVHGEQQFARQGAYPELTREAKAERGKAGKHHGLGPHPGWVTLARVPHPTEGLSLIHI